MYHIKELCVKLVTYQNLYRDARSVKYILKKIFLTDKTPLESNRLLPALDFVFGLSERKVALMAMSDAL